MYRLVPTIGVALLLLTTACDSDRGLESDQTLFETGRFAELAARNDAEVRAVARDVLSEMSRRVVGDWGLNPKDAPIEVAFTSAGLLGAPSNGGLAFGCRNDHLWLFHEWRLQDDQAYSGPVSIRYRVRNEVHTIRQDASANEVQVQAGQVRDLVSEMQDGYELVATIDDAQGQFLVENRFSLGGLREAIAQLSCNSTAP